MVSIDGYDGRLGVSVMRVQLSLSVSERYGDGVCCGEGGSHRAETPLTRGRVEASEWFTEAMEAFFLNPQ